MENVLSPATDHTSRAPIWIGRVLTGLVVTFLFFDAFGKLVPLAVVVEACQKMGLAYETVRAIGAVLAVSTVLHLIPRTRLLGALLLTAFLGGATAIHVYVRTPLWFPVLMGVLLWAGYVLREPRLRALL